MSSLKVLHLNIERDKHLDKVSKLIEATKPDVLCFAEAVDTDVEKLATYFQYKFCHSPLLKLPTGGKEGSAILSKFPVTDITKHYYGDSNKNTPLIELPSAGIVDGNRPKDRFLYQYSVLSVKIKDKNGEIWTIATTHFPVIDHSTPGHNDHELDEVSDVREINHANIYFKRLISVIKKLPSPLVFTADLNNPRGEYSYDALAHELVDLVPKKINSTLDPKLHRTLGSVQLVVDTIMVSPDINAIKTEIIDGVSDHKAIFVELKLSR